MSSTFFGLNIAYSGLLASNAALLTTANNVSNVQTDGYSRQNVNQVSANPIQVFQTYGCAGAGVQTLSVERTRDEFYDEKYWKNNTGVGEYKMKSYYMEQLEGYFYDDGHNAGFTSVFDQLMTKGLQELMKDPSNTRLKSQFVGYASALTDYFNNMTGNLHEMQADINSELKLKVDEINSLADQIATLNKQINTIEMTGPNANELRDARDLLIDQLSEIVDVEVVETPVIDSNNPDRVTGANRYIVRIAGGQLLVDSSMAKQLGCVARPTYEKLHQSDIDGLYDIYWLNADGSQGQKFSLYNEAMGGALRGLVQMRDGSNSEYFSGTITDTQVNGYTDADGNPHDLITVKIDDPAFNFLKDLNKSNMSDTGGIINLGNQVFYYESWSMTLTADGAGGTTCEYQFVLSDDKELNGAHVTNDRLGKKATIGENVNYQGIPYYMSQMNEWIRTFAQKFNDVLKKGNDNKGTILFTGDHATDADQYQFGDASRFDVFQDKVANKTAAAGDQITVTSGDDSYYRLTAENMNILVAMKRDPGLMTNHYSLSDGVEQSDLLKDLSEVATNRDVLKFRGSSANEFLQNILSDVALNAANANTFKSNFTNLQNSIQNTRLSIYGVDEDEEAVNLVKYQNAYNLAAKMIQTFSEIYDRLILETGV